MPPARLQGRGRVPLEQPQALTSVTCLPHAAQATQAVSELLDPYHDRASIKDGSQFVCNPGQVLDNVELAMERLDNDIDTPIGIEDDVASMDELHALLQQMAMGPTLISHVVDTAMRIMLARYPETLVRAPFPPEYDLRALVPVQMDDWLHNVAKSIFNRRMGMHTDLAPGELDNELDSSAARLRNSLPWQDQLQVFVAVFFMFGTKVGALQYRTSGNEDRGWIGKTTTGTRRRPPSAVASTGSTRRRDPVIVPVGGQHRSFEQFRQGAAGRIGGNELHTATIRIVRVNRARRYARTYVRKSAPSHVIAKVGMLVSTYPTTQLQTIEPTWVLSNVDRNVPRYAREPR